MNPIIEEKQIRTYFLVSIFLKGAISFVECVAGVAAFFVPLPEFFHTVLAIVASILGPSLGALVIPHLAKIVQDITSMSVGFIGLYLLSRGLIKLVLIIAMLKNELRAYPLSLLVIGGFVLYQCYQIATHGSLGVVVLTVFDLIVMYFIWREYKILCRHPLSH
jgi:uncharacterized membrane protein